MNLKIRLSDNYAYRMIEMGQRRFLLKKSNMIGRSYYWGLLPKQVSFDVVELDENDDRFYFKEKKVNTTTIVLMVQPFVNSLSSFLEKMFINFNIGEKIILELGLFAFSMFLSYLTVIFWKNSLEKRAESKLPKNCKHYRLTFILNSKKRMPLGPALLSVNVILLILFIHTSAGPLLIINSAYSTLVFMMIKIPDMVHTITIII